MEETVVRAALAAQVRQEQVEHLETAAMAVMEVRQVLVEPQGDRVQVMVLQALLQSARPKITAVRFTIQPNVK